MDKAGVRHVRVGRVARGDGRNPGMDTGTRRGRAGKGASWARRIGLAALCLAAAFAPMGMAGGAGVMEAHAAPTDLTGIVVDYTTPDKAIYDPYRRWHPEAQGIPAPFEQAADAVNWYFYYGNDNEFHHAYCIDLKKHAFGSHPDASTTNHRPLTDEQKGLLRYAAIQGPDVRVFTVDCMVRFSATQLCIWIVSENLHNDAGACEALFTKFASHPDVGNLAREYLARAKAAYASSSPEYLTPSFLSDAEAAAQPYEMAPGARQYEITLDDTNRVLGDLYGMERLRVVDDAGMAITVNGDAMTVTGDPGAGVTLRFSKAQYNGQLYYLLQGELQEMVTFVFSGKSEKELFLKLKARRDAAGTAVLRAAKAVSGEGIPQATFVFHARELNAPPEGQPPRKGDFKAGGFSDTQRVSMPAGGGAAAAVAFREITGIAAGEKRYYQVWEENGGEPGWTYAAPAAFAALVTDAAAVATVAYSASEPSPTLDVSGAAPVFVNAYAHEERILRIAVEVDKDTIRRTSAAYVSLPGHEGIDNVYTEQYRYDVNFRSVSNTDADELIVDDPLEAVTQGHLIRVDEVWTPVVFGDTDGKYRLLYKSASMSGGIAPERSAAFPGAVYPNDGWRVWTDAAAPDGVRDTDRRYRLAAAALLAPGDYLTAMRYEYGHVEVGFTSKDTKTVSKNGEHRGNGGAVRLPAHNGAEVDLIDEAERGGALALAASSDAGGGERIMLADSPTAADGAGAWITPAATGIGDDGGGAFVDWRVDPASDTYNPAYAGLGYRLKGAAYMVRIPRAMSGQFIVSSATARIARTEGGRVMKGADQDAVLTDEITTFTLAAPSPDPYAGIQSTIVEKAKDAGVQVRERGADGKLTGRVISKGMRGARSAATGDGAMPDAWLALAASAAICLALLLRRRARGWRFPWLHNSGRKGE